MSLRTNVPKCSGVLVQALMALIWLISPWMFPPAAAVERVTAALRKLERHGALWQLAEKCR